MPQGSGQVSEMNADKHDARPFTQVFFPASAGVGIASEHLAGAGVASKGSAGLDNRSIYALLPTLKSLLLICSRALVTFSEQSQDNNNNVDLI